MGIVQCLFNLLYYVIGVRNTKKPPFKLVDINLGSSEAYLLKLEKNLSYGFAIIFFPKKYKIYNFVSFEIIFFVKNAVLNISRYLKRFYTYRKIFS